MAKDLIEVQIWVRSKTTATVVMRNLTAQPAKPAVIIPLTAPPNVYVAGLDAEWIVERPAYGNNPSDFSTLANYSSLAITNAIAWAQPVSPSPGNLSLRDFLIARGSTQSADLRSVAASLNFPLPVSLRVILTEAWTVPASSGTTLTMMDNGVTLSTAQISGDSEIDFKYVGPQTN